MFISVHGLVFENLFFDISNYVYAVSLNNINKDEIRAIGSKKMWEAAFNSKSKIAQDIFIGTNIGTDKKDYLARLSYTLNVKKKKTGFYESISIDPILIKNILQILNIKALSSRPDNKDVKLECDGLIRQYIAQRLKRYQERIEKGERIPVSAVEQKKTRANFDRSSLIETAVKTFFEELATDHEKAWKQISSDFKKYGPWENCFNRFQDWFSDILSINNMKVEIDVCAHNYAEGRIHLDCEKLQLNSPELSYISKSKWANLKQARLFEDNVRKELTKLYGKAIDNIVLHADLLKYNGLYAIIKKCKLNLNTVSSLFLSETILLNKSYKWTCKLESGRWLLDNYNNHNRLSFA